MNKKIFIFRHGETDWNAIEKLQGHADTPLNDKGRRQAADLAVTLDAKRLQVIISSDLRRAHDTATIIAGQLGDITVVPMPELRELNLGIAQGMTRSDLRKKYGEASWYDMESNDPALDDASFPGGETKRQATARAVSAITTYVMHSQYDRIGVATHGFLIKLLVVALTGNYQFPFDIPNGAIFAFDFDLDSRLWCLS